MKNLQILIISLLVFSLGFSQDNQFDNNIEKLKASQLTFNNKKIKEISTSLINDGKMSLGLLSLNYNNVIGLELNSIVITQANNDTYPIWVLQNTKDIRSDILVINLELIQNEKYRNKLFSKNGIIGCISNSPKEIINHLVKSQHERSIYLSSSVQANLLDEHSGRLYITGLPLKYSKFKFNNLKDIKNNYENKYLLDYLKTDLYTDTGENDINNSNLNYIPAFILLEEHYQKTGEKIKANSLNLLIRNISTKAGKSEELSQYYAKKNRSNSSLMELPFAEFQKNLQKVENGLYADGLELTNEWYNYFLEELLYNKDYDLLKKYGSTKTDWNKYLTEQEKQLDNKTLFLHGFPTEDYHPVQNISFEAAEAFCSWLTIKYNAWASSKKKFNQVVFKLPTETQWQKAAKANLDATNYPWDYTVDNKGKTTSLNTNGAKNEKGCYLGNFYSNKEDCKNCPIAEINPNSKDGGFFTVRADSYWPNSIGLYNTVGNVAEMVNNRKAYGGSWNNKPQESTINNAQDIEGGKPWIGFRVFMTVNE